MWHAAERGVGAPPFAIRTIPAKAASAALPAHRAAGKSIGVSRPARGWRSVRPVLAALCLLATAGTSPPAAAAPAPGAGSACITEALPHDICLRDSTAGPGLLDAVRTAQACPPPPRCRQDQRPCNIRRDRNTGCITWQCCPR